MEKEKDIENAILTWLNLQPGIFAFKVQTGGFFDTKRKKFRKHVSRFIMPGTSDIIGLLNGRFFAIEVKTPTTIKRYQRYPTDADKRQQWFIEQINNTGGIACCVCSLQEVMDLVKHETLNSR